MKPLTIILTALTLLPSVAAAEISEKQVEYHEGDAKLIGTVVTDSAMKAGTPGVLIFSDWLGVGPFAKERATQLAKLGYAAFVADIYGNGILAKDPKEAGTLAGKFKADRPLMRRRARAALDAFRKNAPVDGAKIAAIGFCFGGTVALELAREGAPLAGLVSFHGGLETPNPELAKNIHGKLLILHGADDPFVPPAEVQNFEKEMNAAGVNWQLVKFSQAVHAFTNPQAGSDNSKGAAYNELAARRAYRAMEDFFQEIF